MNDPHQGAFGPPPDMPSVPPRPAVPRQWGPQPRVSTRRRVGLIVGGLAMAGVLAALAIGAMSGDRETLRTMQWILRDCGLDGSLLIVSEAEWDGDHVSVPFADGRDPKHMLIDVEHSDGEWRLNVDYPYGEICSDYTDEYIQQNR